MGLLLKVEQLYNQSNTQKKNLILVGLFFIIVFMFLEMFFFSSYAGSINGEEKIKEIEKDIVVVREENIVLNNHITKNSKENLLKQKQELEAELKKIVEQKGSFGNVDNLSKAIRGLIDNIGSLKLNEFKSLGSKIDEKVNLFKVHSFEIKVSGQYQSIYDFVLYLNNLKFIKVEGLTIERNESILSGDILISIRNQKEGFIEFNEQNKNSNITKEILQKEIGDKK